MTKPKVPVGCNSKTVCIVNILSLWSGVSKFWMVFSVLTCMHNKTGTLPTSSDSVQKQVILSREWHGI